MTGKHKWDRSEQGEASDAFISDLRGYMFNKHISHPPMTKAMLDFATELYQEHLEEASFLYDQRLSLFDDPEITWLDIENFEERFEAHIDALVIGEEFALEICKTQTMEGDFGELHAAMRVFCRQDRLDLVHEVLEALDPEDPEKVQAVTDAFNYELPSSWQDQFIRMLSEGDQKLTAVVAKLAGYRRLPAGKELLELLEPDNTGSLSALVWAIGRLRERAAQQSLLSYLQHENEAIRSAAALALLRIGEPETIRLCLPLAESEGWALLPVGLGGGRSAVSTLLNIASDNKASPNCLTALGLLGDIAAVETLISGLSNEELAESGAMALNLITGAGLYEQVFIPEEIEEDELFEEELEKLKKGEALYPPGEEPGTTITRISQKQEAWQVWWTENKARFNPSIRYRNGKPYSPACLVENLRSEKSPRLVRRLAYEELVIRYGIDFPFETDMFVAKQKQAIAQYAQWVEANASRFREGDWYFAGQPMTK